MDKMYCICGQNDTVEIYGIKSRYCSDCWKNNIPILREEMCSICLEKANNPSITQCSHVFCKECLIEWITIFYKHETSKTLYPCPMCRKVLHTQ